MLSCFGFYHLLWVLGICIVMTIVTSVIISSKRKIEKRKDSWRRMSWIEKLSKESYTKEELEKMFEESMEAGKRISDEVFGEDLPKTEHYANQIEFLDHIFSIYVYNMFMYIGNKEAIEKNREDAKIALNGMRKIKAEIENQTKKVNDKQESELG